jgi:hypothetical protein
MQTYKSIFSEASKAKLKLVPSKKGLVYKIENFPAYINPNFMNKLQNRNIQNFNIEGNYFASDIYFCASYPAFVSVLIGDTELVMGVPDTTWEKWDVKVGVGFTPDGTQYDKTELSDKKAMKWFNDKVTNIGYIAVGDWFREPKDISEQTSQSVNSYLSTAITSVNSDVELAKTTLKTPKPKAAAKIPKEQQWFKDNQKLLKTPENISNLEWSVGNYIVPKVGFKDLKKMKDWISKKKKQNDWREPTSQEFFGLINTQPDVIAELKSKKVNFVWTSSGTGSFYVVVSLLGAIRMVDKRDKSEMYYQVLVRP